MHFGDKICYINRKFMYFTKNDYIQSFSSKSCENILVITICKIDKFSNENSSALYKHWMWNYNHNCNYNIIDFQAILRWLIYIPQMHKYLYIYGHHLISFPNHFLLVSFGCLSIWLNWCGNTLLYASILITFARPISITNKLTLTKWTLR